MRIEISKKEAKELYEKTGKLKYRILSEMVENTKEDLEREVKERVKWLLKEIEKEFDSIEETYGMEDCEDYWISEIDGKVWDKFRKSVLRKIKKAFEVVEE